MQIPEAWRGILPQKYDALLRTAESTYAAATVYPPEAEVFSALELTPPSAVRAVILGQDPYHEPGQAHGLAFSVKDGTRLPPSLKNIFSELSSDLGIPAPGTGDLTPWAKQGVLLLNTVLTVEAGTPLSHRALGWQTLTDAIIASLSSLPQPIAFVLWGGEAQKKKSLIFPAAGQRLVLTAPHPSPLSVYRGFYGTKPFSKINEFLKNNGQTPVNWAL